jgi:hypothetical protein
MAGMKVASRRRRLQDVDELDLAHLCTGPEVTRRRTV